MKNKELGLPYDIDGKMEKVLVVFDVDGTLINNEATYMVTLTLLEYFTVQKWKNVDVAVWSGGGADYAKTQINRRLKDLPGLKFYSKLQHFELRTKYHKIIAFDDIQDTRIGDVNLIVRNK